MTKVKVVIFDVGGTTVQDSADVAGVFGAALAQYHVATVPEALQSWRGASKRDVIYKLVNTEPRSNVEPSRVYKTFQTLLIDAFLTQGVKAIPGAETAFGTLRAHRVKVVLITGFDATVMDVLLEHLKWTHIVDEVLTSDDVLRGRPAPDLVLGAMRSVGVRDRKAVVTVGDTVNDLRAAAAAGVGVSIGVLTGAHDRTQLAGAPHTAILPSAADVPQWLADREWSGGANQA